MAGCFPWIFGPEKPLKQFEIVLDSPTNSYYAGSVVSGRVLLSLDAPKRAKGIKIRIVGRASLFWTEMESRENDEGEYEIYPEVYSAEEQYFSVGYYLLGSSSGDIEIPIGDHAYPFKTTLPPKLPTGFDGAHGCVKYLVEATIRRPWKTNHKVRHFFQVITLMDLNYIAMAKEPIKKEKEKYFCCCCCKSGPLTMVLYVPHSGFVAGQEMPVWVEIDNASDVAVNEVKFELVKSITWIAGMPRNKMKTTSEKLLETKAKGVTPNSSRTWIEILKIPNMPFLNLDDCSIMKLEFLLKVSTEVSAPHCNLECSSNWTLGNVPIASDSFYPGNADTNAPEFAKPSAPDLSLLAQSDIPGNAVAVDDRQALNQYF